MEKYALREYEHNIFLKEEYEHNIVSTTISFSRKNIYFFKNKTKI